MSVLTPSRMIGMEAELKRMSIGRSTSSGSIFSARSMRSRMSEMALSRLVPQVKRTMTELVSSELMEVISSMPVTALIWRSIGRVMSSSTSCGEASS